jgi:hypothetical protein
LAKLLGKKYTVDDADYFWSSKKTNTLNDKETFLSAKSWIFTIAILWGLILQNWEKRQKTKSYLS